MKKNIILILIIFMITQGMPVFAAQEAKVISDSEKQKQILEDFKEVNQYTDYFFTPRIDKTKLLDTSETEGVAKTIKLNEVLDTGRKSPPPVKKLRIMLKNKKIKSEKMKAVEEGAEVKEEISEEPTKDQMILDCDYMEYFADRTELEANGDVVMTFPQNDSVLEADKMIYNQSSNLIKAFGNVVLINAGKEMQGDYLVVDMNEENGLMDNPISDLGQVRARAKKGYMYGDKTISEQGDFLVTKRTPVDMKAEMLGPDLDRMFVKEEDKGYFMKDSHGSKFKIATRDLIINSKKEHDDVTLKHATIYCNGKNIGTIPSITIHSNKKHDYIEADYPELGTLTNIGMYAGPGFVFDTPHGTTLKLLPILNYQSDTSNPDNSKLGWGGIAKFKSASNKTDIAYGTANDVFMMRGIQYLDDNLYFQYASNAYMDDWFMGFRMPRLMGELVYRDSYFTKDFFGKDKDLIFSQRVTGAYVQDGVAGKNSKRLGEDGIGSLRIKYMNEVSQTLYKFNEENDDTFNARLSLVGQGSAALYGTGATQIVGRIGPMLHAQYKYWMQDTGYFLSAYDDHTPFIHFDRYMYGKSNAYTRQSIRLCKYLTLSWMGSVNLSDDSPNKKMLQENAFFFGIGPDDIRLNIGYDTIRQQTFVTMNMHLDAKGSTLEYKKMVVKNPETFGKDKNGDKDTQEFSEPSEEQEVDNTVPLLDEDGNEIPEKAEVINISQVRNEP